MIKTSTCPRNPVRYRWYYYALQAALFEISEDPRYLQSHKLKAQTLFNHFDDGDLERIEKCFSSAMDVDYPKDLSLPFSPFQSVSKCLNFSFAQKTFTTTTGLSKQVIRPIYFAVNLAKEFPHHPGRPISETGWIEGNKLDYLTYNDTSPEIANKLQETFFITRTLYPLEGAGSYESMKTVPPREVFTKAQGYEPVESHPVWGQHQGTFAEIIRALDKAEESVFLDVFFLGGTMGAALAKHLVKLIEEKPELKVFVLRDNYNNFGHKHEMRPIFNFLKAYSFHHPTRMVISEAFVEYHPSGLPPFMHSLLSTTFLKESGLQDHLMFHSKIKSDHSKVFVVDGKSENPVAFVGSKNLTDSSGGFCYDDVIKVTGPGAAVILDDYYLDMLYSLRYELPSKDRAFLIHLAKEGWAKEYYRVGQSVEEMAANILQPFDLLSRNESMKHTPGLKVEVPSQGQGVLRTGMNNVDSSKTSALDEDLQLIYFAKETIYIRDQFLFDRNVILALLKAKKSNPRLKIRAILEPLTVATPAGLPNLLYLDVLKDAGIEVKWKRTNNSDAHPNISQEYHMKTISADGTYIISGSANKDQTTLYGSFREQQVDAFDKGATQVHDARFEMEWEDPDETSEVFESFDFEVPAKPKGIDGKKLTPLQFIKFLRNIVSVLFDATTL